MQKSADLAEQPTAGEDLYRQLIDSIKDYAVFMLAPSGHVATWSAGAERLKGYRACEILGQPFTVFYPEADVRAGKCDMELAVAAVEGRFEDEGWRIRKDGSRFWANVIISAIRDKTGALLGFSKVTRDLTERKQAEEERAARLAAEQASRAKDEFMAMLGHELRNPLAPIVTALQLMKLRGSGKVSSEQRIIERQVAHMVRLVDDLLDVSRITRGDIALDRRPVDVRGVVARAIETASPLFEERRHDVQVDIPEHEIVVLADEGRLVQVFANLFTNAAKYTDPAGHITIRVSAVAHEAVLEVADDGVGIPADLLPRIFELFVQAPQGLERPQGGLGIGLALVYRLLAMHGGNVHARSPGLGKGSTFTARLPIHGAPAAAAIGVAPPAPSLEPGKRQQVLVIDDNADARDLIAEALTRLGHDVRSAPDGLVALQLLTTFQPDVAIVDIGLPMMNGYEVAARIRDELGAAAPRMIALTGYGHQHDRQRSLDAGFEQHLVKPIELSKLIDCVKGRPKT